MCLSNEASLKTKRVVEILDRGTHGYFMREASKERLYRFQPSCPTLPTSLSICILPNKRVNIKWCFCEFYELYYQVKWTQGSGIMGNSIANQLGKTASTTQKLWQAPKILGGFEPLTRGIWWDLDGQHQTWIQWQDVQLASTGKLLVVQTKKKKSTSRNR